MELPEPSTSYSQQLQPCSIRRHRVLLAATGTTAASSFSELCLILSRWADVKAVATPPALCFIDTKSIPANVTLYTDQTEWSCWNKVGDSVLHVELCRWADILLIAPLSANTLAKIAGGVCDNLLTCIVRGWDCERKAVFIAPSMNPCMWENSFTEKHLMAVDEMGINLIPPVRKMLASGEYGNGFMAEPAHINETMWMFLEQRDPPPS